MNRITIFSNVPQQSSLGSHQALFRFASSLQVPSSDCPPKLDFIALTTAPPSRLRSFYLFIYLATSVFSRYLLLSKSFCVIVCGAESFGAAFLIKILFSDKKLILYTNGPEPRYNNLRSALGLANRLSPSLIFQNLCFRSLLSYVDQVTVNSLFDRDWIISTLRVPPLKVSVFEPLLRPGFISQVPYSDRPKNFCFCGTWQAKKGVDILVDFINYTFSIDSDWKLHIITNTPDIALEYLRHRGTPMTRVVIHSQLSRTSDLSQIYNMCRFALHFSRLESFGIASLEAIVCGCILITSKMGIGYEISNPLLARVDFAPDILYRDITLIDQSPEPFISYYSAFKT